MGLIENTSVTVYSSDWYIPILSRSFIMLQSFASLIVFIQCKYRHKTLQYLYYPQGVNVLITSMMKAPMR